MCILGAEPFQQTQVSGGIAKYLGLCEEFCARISGNEEAQRAPQGS